ncbi:hypothetical protein [Pseudomonas sp. UMAB-40]|uniref:hypothetical protein n=1 Tax=Pseudomonas sp. UMAB-40 TaxID=1365407 RepID=UPI001C588580|nr:hypothetical protein [Pseudomonas sp. UMAB-40]
MSEVLAVRESDLVMRDLAQAKTSVIEAQRVLIVGANSIPKLLVELNTSLADLGYVCVPIQPAQGLYKTFADLLECPSLAPLLSATEVVSDAPDIELDPPPADDEELIQAENQIIALEESLALSRNATEPVAVDSLSAPVEVWKLDMSKPINWKLGDVFQDNPRITLPHKCRKWILDSLDISDLANLSGMDVQIRSPNTTTTELLTLKQFMAQYVFHSRPVAEQSAAE